MTVWEVNGSTCIKIELLCAGAFHDASVCIRQGRGVFESVSANLILLGGGLFRNPVIHCAGATFKKVGRRFAVTKTCSAVAQLDAESSCLGRVERG